MTYHLICYAKNRLARVRDKNKGENEPNQKGEEKISVSEAALPAA